MSDEKRYFELRLENQRLRVMGGCIILLFFFGMSWLFGMFGVYIDTGIMVSGEEFIRGFMPAFFAVSIWMLTAFGLEVVMLYIYQKKLEWLNNNEGDE